MFYVNDQSQNTAEKIRLLCHHYGLRYATFRANIVVDNKLKYASAKSFYIEICGTSLNMDHLRRVEAMPMEDGRVKYLYDNPV